MRYYIGLDMGTSSVGWAVTDERYHIVRRKGKDVWGVRLFDEAQTAADRRSHRTSRRRKEREQARIACLKEIFAPAICEKDPGFFVRLDDSKFWQEDKIEHQPFALFSDTGYTDEEYFRDYPTIFHLRMQLIESSEEHDVRLVYLAILNMFKHRGHFLNPNLNDGEIGSFAELWDELKLMFEERFEHLGKTFPVIENIQNIEKILADRSMSASEKKDRLIDCMNIEKKQKNLVEMAKLICGLKGNISAIFEDEPFSAEDSKFSVSFRDTSYEEEEITVENMLSSDSFELFLKLKQIYDWGVLASIMTDGEKTYAYFSEAKVASYDKHKADLHLLKDVYHKYLPNYYDGMFRMMENNNYSAYVGHVNSRESKRIAGTSKVRRGAKSDDFFKTLKKQLQTVEDPDGQKVCSKIIEEIDRGLFLPKQRTSDNGVVPNQIHKAELKKILHNAQKYLHFLNETDPESGLTASEQILALFSFRIPYYVGPIKGNELSNHWAIRKADGKIYPWNFADKVDEKKTSEMFIKNLIRRCSYLTDEEVLPKSSLLYEKFEVLNELNNLKVHDERISTELKQSIYEELFRETGKRVTNKKLVEYLKIQGVLSAEDTENVLSGYDKAQGGFTSTLANYHKFMEVFQVSVLTDRQVEIAEGVIFYSTVYGNSKKFLKEKIEQLYGNELDAGQLKRILGFRFKDWGRLSKKFLMLEGVDTDTGEIKSLIGRMWEENCNLMQLLDHDNYTYYEEIVQQTKKIEKSLQEVTQEDLLEFYISAPVRRMVWQTIRVVQEIEKVMGEAPERIFIEMTRSSSADKKRTVSRKSRLLDLYKGYCQSEESLVRRIEGEEEYKLRQKKLYLYYLQKGRCMYSGETIQFDHLFDDGWYDIDHIYPRRYIKDDSLENNLVLVKKEINADKSDKYPISEDIRRQQAGMWKALRDARFLSAEKYKRLTRNYPLSENELAGFINRQLVETSQGTKAVAEILGQLFSGRGNAENVVYVKAGNVSDFRNEYKLLKCRTVNDFHLAKDAYLNIVVGNTWHTKFTKNARKFFVEGGDISSYNISRLFEHRVERGKVLAWDPKEDIKTVRSVMAKNSPLVTKRSYVVHGGLFDQQLVGASAVKKAQNSDTYMPVKTSDSRLSDTRKYGGYNKVSGAYFFLVEHTRKNKLVRTIEYMPVYQMDRYQSRESLEEYCRTILKLENPHVRWDMIRIGSLIKVNGFFIYLTGRSGNRLLMSNAVQLCLRPEYTGYIREVVKVVENNASDEELMQTRDQSEKHRKNIVSSDANLKLYGELMDKHTNGIFFRRMNPIGSILEQGREDFVQLSLSEQCYILSQILQISQHVNQGVDLRKIGGKKNSGVAMLNKDITNLTECKLILQSVTGLYEQEIDLLVV